MSRFLRGGNAWVVLGVAVVFAAWSMFVWALVNDALTAENMRLILGSILTFLGVLVVFDTIIRPLIIEPIVAIMRLRPRPRRPDTPRPTSKTSAVYEGEFEVISQ